MNRKRERLFSVTAKDCVFQATRGSGPGGQHRNKVATAIRCKHTDSGAVGYASDDKSQHRNKRKAFLRMAESKKFRDWVKIEASRRTGDLARIEAEVSSSIKKVRVEVKDIRGIWVECLNSSLLDTPN